MSDIQYYDYRYKCALADLPVALRVLDALRAASVLHGASLPANMLGDARDATGALVGPDVEPAFVGRTGRAASTFTDDSTQQTITTPPTGDPGYWYFAVRTTLDALPVDPTTFGLIACSAEESAAVLGVWA